VLFYALARWRATPGLALVATLPLLVMGSAFEVTATPYGSVVLLPMAFGLAALVCITRLRSAGDPLTCLLLIMAIASLSDGLAFLAGVAAMLVLQSGRRAPKRSWVVIVPVLLYAVWYVWAHQNGVPSQAHVRNLEQVPAQMLNSAAAGLAAVTGFLGGTFDPQAGNSELAPGYLLLGLAVVAVGVRWREGARPAREIWLPLATAIAFWALLALVIDPVRPATSSRYLYPSAAFLLLIGLELVRGIRVTRPGALLVVALLAVSMIPNVVELNRQAKAIRSPVTGERVELGALELLATEVPGRTLPSLAPTNGIISVAPSGLWSGADYVSAVDRFGSPAISSEQIAAMGGLAGVAADQILLSGGDLTATSFHASGGSCAVAAGPVPVPSGGLVVIADPGRTATVGARRFGPSFQPLKPTPGAVVVRPAAATAGPPWIVQVDGATVCRSSTRP